jgi:lipopolysaccharide transport system permease protein
VLVLLILLIMGRLQMGAGAWVAMVAYGLIVVNAAALSLLLAPLNVFFRDVGTLLPQILTFWMLLTPIFFDRALLRADLGEWLALNPMTGLVEALRAGLLHDQVDLTTLYSPLLFTLVLTLCSVIAARRFLARIEDFL